MGHSVSQHVIEADFLKQQWPAFLRLQLAGHANSSVSNSSTSNRLTRLTKSEHHGPLYVQKPFYPEGQDYAHIYLLHPPGGLCSGDDLQISINADNKAGVLITSPGATRLYKARSAANHEPLDNSSNAKPQRIVNRLHIAGNSSIEWLPMETIVYPSANADLQTHIQMEQGSQFIAWEIVCLGLPASDKPFNAGRLQQTLQVSIDGRLALLDRLQLQQPQPLSAASSGLKNNSVFAVMLAGPFDQSPDDLLQQLQAGRVSDNQHNLLGISYVNNFIVARFLGQSAFVARDWFISLWMDIRPYLIQREAVHPAIWRT